MSRGQQRRVPAPGVSPAKRHESVAIDWRSGHVCKTRGPRRNADIFCEVVRQSADRSAARKRRAIIVTDGPKFHKPEGSKKVRLLLEHYGSHLQLEYIPKYDPDSNPTELFWRDWRSKVTHNHDHRMISDLARASDRYFDGCRHNPKSVLRKIGSCFVKQIP